MGMHIHLILMNHITSCTPITNKDTSGNLEIYVLFGFSVNARSYRIPRYDENDGCARIHNEYISKNTTFFTYTDVRDCYMNFPFDKEIASQTIQTLDALFHGFYPFLYKAKEPPQREFHFKPIDLLVQLNRLQKRRYDTLFQFMDGVRKLIFELRDAHTSFITNCFSSFVFYTNLTLYSIVTDDGVQKIKVFNDTIDPTNINCEVTHIDGRRAIQVITEFPNYISKDLGVRFNVALDVNYPGITFFTRVDLPETPSITYTLNCDNHPKLVKRNWSVIGIQTILNNFNNSKTYFSNICKNSTNDYYQQLIAKLLEIKEAHKNVRELKSNEHVITIIYEIVDFISFFKEQDFGIVKIKTEDVHLNNTLAVEIITGFQALANTGVKKVVLDLSDNLGGFVLISNFINLLLFPDANTFYNMDIRVTKQFKLVLQGLVNLNEIVSSTNLTKFQYVEDLIGNNFYTRGGVTERYSNRFLISNPYEYKDLISRHLIAPLPWKSDDLIILTNSLCGSSCALIAEGAAEVNNVTTVAVGGFVNSPLSYSSCQGGVVIDSTLIFNIISKLNLQNNTLMPKPFILGGKLTIPSSEFYSIKNSDKILEFLYRPADFRLFYDDKNFRDRSILWSQAAAFIGRKPKIYS
ncbi:19689_t:CDS:2 [Cetraspora pellucida]|uniref:19689_t:CDS:1 n=1 Tax=Cetraspora pellucida TaxID=1433469 RepID=A0A9N9GBD2_9GLOM|nr:19689_t:CDS:2 [Cetraspora pellucida]